MSTTDKHQIRTAAARLVKNLSREERRIANKTICETLRKLAEEIGARSVLAYAALRDEVDLSPLFETLQTTAIQVFVPVVLGEELKFRSVEALRTAGTRSALGVYEPDRSAAHWDPLQAIGHVVILCPGRAFDRTGTRLGRGGGYYDRFVAKVRDRDGVADLASISVVGVCYQAQLFESIPREVHDQPMELLVTENGRISTIST